MLLKARFDAIAEQGGQRAVKKAIDKRKKKVAQKEKRERPYAKGQIGGGSATPSMRRPKDVAEAKKRKLTWD